MTLKNKIGMLNSIRDFKKQKIWFSEYLVTRVSAGNYTVGQAESEFTKQAYVVKYLIRVGR